MGLLPLLRLQLGLGKRHFVVTPNPCYLNPATDMEERFAKIKKVLLNWYGAKKMVGVLEVSFN